MKINNIAYDVAVAGGGLAGLAAAIQLSGKGFKVILFEKKFYPFHRVCGEYVSEESRPFLQSLGISLDQLKLPSIRKLVVSAPDGELLDAALQSGGFGISRYRLDALLAGQAKAAGVHILEGTKVHDILYEKGAMKILSQHGEINAAVAIGSFGKRSNLDVQWKREFTLAKGGKLNNFIGVKYHIRLDHPPDTIALHNFEDGYCGLSRIEDGLSCLCYLTTANNLGLSNNSIAQMERRVLWKNPHLEKIFSAAEMIWSEPLIISQVSFSNKPLLHDHVLMAGDAAGMITPLCGNGMSMALHSSKILAGHAARFLRNEISREEMEKMYRADWRKNFSRRLFAGRSIQRFFGDPLLSKILVRTARIFPGVTNFLVQQTHGEQF
ncbi:NAD(P)/FAD-dependent oxidoreductase [Flavihumibacter profundi]|jgi:menaquinone-9 beta-reductase|uniref:NAD(P)/FAD-dependent oxidoreductase n=1 Tax=Flavihumibacter profundi TaxID=2716883 RepID=UPI001CC3CBC1|nr:FAD-dependent monooxygenase [Flavihumibacter profundi]MBZ5858204.1 FAD-dependent monooxygenase [Flavihumibacter profundi]